jgi:hypothetical protein
MGGVVGSPEDISRPTTTIDPFEHEQRFILTRAQVVAFYSAIGGRASLELYDEARPISYTRTTYLDTDDFAFFRSCEGPVARRLRIRQYAVATAPGETPVLSHVCFLELKQNAGTARSKVRLSAPPHLLDRLIRQRGLIDARDPELGSIEPLAALKAIQAELATACMSPRLTTWYRRTCLCGEGGRVRITLDENLTFCQPQPLGAAGDVIHPEEAFASGPARILEIKHWGERPDWIARAVDGFSPAPSFSKFRIGMLALQQYGDAPSLPESRTTTPAPTLFVLAGPAT